MPSTPRTERSRGPSLSAEPRRGATIDITSARAASEARTALALSEAHFRLLADRAIDVVFENDSDRRVSWVSSNVSRVLGWTSRELLGTRLVELIHPDDRSELDGPQPAGRVGVEPASGETALVLRCRTRMGEYRWVAGTTLVEVSPGGGRWNVICGLRDVDELVRARERAESAEAFLRTLIDTLLDPHVVLDPVRDPDGAIVDFVFAQANAAACDFNRLPRDELVGSSLLALHPAAATSGLLDSYIAVIETGEPLDLPLLEYPQDALGGELRTYEVHAARVGGAISQSWRDITERVAAANAREQAERRYRLLAENAMDLVMSLDTRAVITWVSPSATTLLGHDPEGLVGRFGGELVHPEDLPNLLEAASESRAGRPTSCRMRMLTAEGEALWVEATPRGLYNDDHELIGGVIGIRDIHQEVLSQAALRHEVEFDALTGLAKRDVALGRIQEILDLRRGEGWALLCLGVNHMTAVNAAYTYAGGDRVLAVVAERLVEAAGASDRVARVAGDEFAVLLRDVVTPGDAANAANRILAAVSGPVAIDDERIDVTGCVGVALASGQRAPELLRDAVAAMHQAAALGTNRWEFLQGDMGRQAREALATQAALSAALTNHEIHAWFMPIVRLCDGSLVGYEALVRWCHEDGTVIPTADFIEVAERSGQILEIDRIVLSESAAALRTLPRECHIAVNVSAATLACGLLVRWVADELRDSGVDPRRLQLEATETSYFGTTEDVTRTMRSLADLGITWWVDDFGTGYSSISHLRDLPVSGIKLDRSFTSDVTNGRSQAAGLARGLAGLAHGLDLLTVAEGVETQEQAEVLAGQGWVLGQGYLYGAAAPL